MLVLQQEVSTCFDLTFFLRCQFMCIVRYYLRVCDLGGYCFSAVDSIKYIWITIQKKTLAKSWKHFHGGTKYLNKTHKYTRKEWCIWKLNYGHTSSWIQRNHFKIVKCYHDIASNNKGKIWQSQQQRIRKEVINEQVFASVCGSNNASNVPEYGKSLSLQMYHRYCVRALNENHLRKTSNLIRSKK